MGVLYEHLIPGDWVRVEQILNDIWRRLNPEKITANNITQGAGGHGAHTVADLQEAHDGNFYHIDETATDPGWELTVEFVGVTAFSRVNCFASYDGAHKGNISLYNFRTATWDCFDAFSPSQAEVVTAGEYTIQNHDFEVPDDTDYIGSGADDGDVRGKFAHEVNGNANDDLDIDVVALYG
jgi:hypothetical protein